MKTELVTFHGEQMTIIEQLREVEEMCRERCSEWPWKCVNEMKVIENRISAIIEEMEEADSRPSSKVASAEGTAGVPANLLIVDDNDGSPRYIEPNSPAYPAGISNGLKDKTLEVQRALEDESRNPDCAHPPISNSAPISDFLSEKPQQGLYRKFEVRRTDGRSMLGEKSG